MSAHKATNGIRKRMIFVSLVLFPAIFILDAMLPLGVAGGIPYIAPVLLSLWVEKRPFTLFLAILATILTLAGIFISPNGVSAWIVLTNRFLAIAAIWITAILTIQRIRVEEELTASRKYVENLIESSLDMIISVDRERKIVEFNIAAEKAFGYAREEVIGKNISILYADQDQYTKPDDILQKSGQFVGEVLNRRKNGEIFPSFVTATYLKDDHGNFIGAMGISRDITEKKLAEKVLNDYQNKLEHLVKKRTEELTHANRELALKIDELQEAEEELKSRALFPTLNPAPVIRCDRNRIVKNVNTAAIEIFGMTELSGMPLESLVPGTDKLEIEDCINTDSIIFHTVELGGRFFQFAIRGHSGMGVAHLYGSDITRRKEAEQKAEEKSAYLDSILRFSTDMAIAATDLDFRITYYNPIAEKYFGYRAEEVIGKTVMEMHTKKNVEPERFERAIEAVKRDGEYRYSVEKEFDGGKHYIESRISGIWDRKKTLMGFVLFSKDVTERKQYEDAIKESEEKYRKIMETANDAIFIADVETGNILDANKKAEILTGRPVNEIIGMHQTQLHPSAEAELYKRLFREHIRDSAHLTEALVLRRDGTIIPVEINTSITEIGGKKVIQGIFRDISYRKEAEEAMRLFQNLLGRTTDAMFVTDPVTGRFLYVNDQACVNLGYSRDEMLELTVMDIEEIMPDISVFKMHIQDLKKTDHMVLEGWHRRKDGTRFPVEANVKHISDGEKEYIVAVVRDITERKRTERELLDSEERFRTAFEYASIGMCLVTLDGAFLRVNNALCAMLGYKETELIGKRFRDITHPEDLETDYEDISRVIKGEIKSFQAEKRYYQKNGDMIWVSMNSAITHDMKGKPAYFVTQIQNITIRKQAEMELKESERRYRAIVEDQTELICRWKPDGTLTFVNDAYCRYFSRKKDDLIGKSFLPLIPEEDQKLFEAQVNTLKSHDIATIEHRVILESGEIRWQQWTDRAIKDDAGKTVEFQSVGRDITKKKKAEEDLNKLKNAIEQAHEMVIITDSNGIIEYTNPAVEKITGFGKSELVGTEVRLSRSIPGSEDTYNTIRETLKSGGIWYGEIINKRKSGELYEEEMTISPIFDEAGAITNFVAIKRDISHEKKLERQLIQSEKLSSIGTFVSGVAHELNNPLTAIIGFSKNLSEMEAIPREAGDAIRIISEQSRRMVAIVRSLLKFSKDRKPGKALTDINELLENTLALHIYHLRADDITIKRAYCENLPKAMVDGNELQQVFMNVIINAHNAMKKFAGQRTLMLKTCLMESGEIFVAIENTGKPIQHERLKKIFDPFYTTMGTEGTGLGLYLSYGILKGMNGKIWAENMGTKGVRLAITLPASAATATDNAKPATEYEEPAPEIPSGIRILFIDDEASIREWLGNMLLKEGIFVQLASNGKEAIKLLEETDYDIVISNVKMPLMDGFDLGRWLIRQKPRYKGRFILATGIIDGAISGYCKEYGCGYIIKPYDRDDIIKSIRAALDRAEKQGGAL